MATTIVGLFDNEHTAHSIREELKDRGLSSRQMDTITWRSLSEGTDPWGIGGQSAGESPTGRLANELKSRGVPADDAQEFAEAVRRGGNLVITELDDDSEADEIARMMDKEESVDLSSRRKKWREHGYAGFNPNADLYSSEEVEKERGTVLGTREELDAGEKTHMQAGHEEVHVGKREVESGGIRVSKRVTEKPVEENVNLREEHARVERQKVDKPGKAGGDKDLFKEESIELTEHSEEPVVEKKVHVDEEIRVGKEVEEHTETVHDTVRATTIDIEELSPGIAEEHGFSRFSQDYRKHYATQFGSQEGRYEEYEPAYRFGHIFGSSDRYKDKNYEAAKPDIRSSYEKKHGAGSFNRYEEAARHAYDRARSQRV